MEKRRQQDHDNRPFKLIYIEQYTTRVEARVKEKYLKSGIGKEFLKGL